MLPYNPSLESIPVNLKKEKITKSGAKAKMRPSQTKNRRCVSLSIQFISQCSLLDTKELVRLMLAETNKIERHNGWVQCLLQLPHLNPTHGAAL